MQNNNVNIDNEIDDTNNDSDKSNDIKQIKRNDNNIMIIMIVI